MTTANDHADSNQRFVDSLRYLAYCEYYINGEEYVMDSVGYEYAVDNEELDDDVLVVKFRYNDGDLMRPESECFTELRFSIDEIGPDAPSVTIRPAD